MDFRNGSNALQGFTREQPGPQQESVYDARGTYVGYTSSQGTFNAQGVRISTAVSPGLLIR
jgi:hypothetical protein